MGVQVLIENPEGKRQFIRPGHRWEDNGSYRNRTGGCGLTLVRDQQQSCINTIMNPLRSIKYRTFLE
jgi:hypothetical protein